METTNKQEEVFDIDYFERELGAIPEEKWNNDSQWKVQENTCCILGHLGRIAGNKPRGFDEENGTYDGHTTSQAHSLTRFMLKAGILQDFNTLTAINNHIGIIDKPTPKQRIMEAIRRVKEFQAKAEQLAKDQAIASKRKVKSNPKAKKPKTLKGTSRNGYPM